MTIPGKSGWTKSPDGVVVIAYERLLTKRVLCGRLRAISMRLCCLSGEVRPRFTNAVWLVIKILVLRSSRQHPPWTRERCTPERVFQEIHC